jgi:hypothetical protein
VASLTPALAASGALALALAGPASLLAASAAAGRAILPPLAPWEGRSRSLVAPPDDPWVTPAEASGLSRTPSYTDTVAYLKRLDAASSEVSLVSLGKSPEGRDLWLAIASAEGVSAPAALKASGKPTLFAQAGIHAGEIDGKDAGLMLLRDMTVRGRRRELLAGANFLFLPIFNVDGHERSGPYGRINQRGPEESGWRTTSANLNLNRDYAKLDAPETRAVVAALDRFDPDLYLDLHVTDGADYQYDITFGYNGPRGHSPGIGGWLEGRLEPALKTDLAAWGHVPGPLVFFVDDADPGRGIGGFVGPPRFSTGYGDVRHLPTVLVENHSLKPYDRRVLGTYVLLQSCLQTLAEHGGELRRAIEADRGRHPASVPLSFRVGEGEPRRIEFLAIAARKVASPVTGGEVLQWTGEPVTLTVPVLEETEPAVTVRRPRAYWIPPGWPEVIERLAQHGIRMERLTEPRTVAVEMFRLEGAKIEAEPFEGRARVVAEPVALRRRETYAPGSVRVPTDQPLGDLAVVLLEPASGDSFLQWGFFLEVLQRTEYVEAYVMEPMARAMLAEDPGLAAEFQKKLAEDAAFAASPAERLQWFYRRTPFWDERWRLYPVAREVEAEGAR